MKTKTNLNRVFVQDQYGNVVSTTWANRAMKLVLRKKAELVCENPLTIRLLIALNENTGDENDK